MPILWNFTVISHKRKVHRFFIGFTFSFLSHYELTTTLRLLSFLISIWNILSKLFFNSISNEWVCHEKAKNERSDISCGCSKTVINRIRDLNRRNVQISRFLYLPIRIENFHGFRNQNSKLLQNKQQIDYSLHIFWFSSFFLWKEIALKSEHF